MNAPNPYRAPESRIATSVDGDIEAVVAGQKLVIYAILVYFLAAAARVAIGPLAFVGAFVALGLALVGIARAWATRPPSRSSASC